MNKRRRKKAQSDVPRKVYVVSDVDDCEYPAIFGVYDSKAAADDAAKRLRDSGDPDYRDAFVEEYTLNACDALADVALQAAHKPTGPRLRSDVHVSQALGQAAVDILRADKSGFIRPQFWR